MIEPRYTNLRGLFTDRVFRIPQYQRFYSWKTKQRDDLFNDLNRLYERGGDDHHFMATIVCYRTPEITTVGTVEYRMYDVVDGQQRLTTLILLLKSVYLLLVEGGESKEEQQELAKLLVKKDANLILLQSNNANQYIFNRFLRDGKIPATAELVTDADRNLAQAIRECDEFVRKWYKDSKSLLDLLRLVQNRLGFVAYDTENAKLVYTLFEVLNSRGLAVDWLDKCKSILMGAAYESAQSADAAAEALNTLQGIWGNVYRTLAKVSISGQEILRVTATLRHGPSKGKPQNADDSLELLRQECTDSTIPETLSNHLLEVSTMLVNLEKDVMLGPVTRILHARILAVALQSTKVLDDKERNSVLRQWERVTFRIFGLAGKDSRTKVGEYLRLVEKVTNEAEGASRYSEIMKSLRELGEDHPAIESARVGLKGANIYEQDPELVRYILWRYEESLAQQLGKAATIDEDARQKVWSLRALDSVEHIFPQNPEPGGAWEGKMARKDGVHQPIVNHVHRIGNLLLLPIALNESARRKGFHEKKLLYKQHHLRQIDEVTRKRNWTLTDIEKREAAIIRWAQTEWDDLGDD